MKEKLVLKEVCFKLVLFALFILGYVLAIPYPRKSREFPQLLAISGTLVVLLSLVIDFTRRRIVKGELEDVADGKLRVIDQETKRLRKKRFYQAWGILLGAALIGFLGGFLFTIFFLFLGFTLVFGKRENLLRNALITVGLTILIYFTFQWIMEVPLLESFLWKKLLK